MYFKIGSFVKRFNFKEMFNIELVIDYRKYKIIFDNLYLFIIMCDL